MAEAEYRVPTHETPTVFNRDAGMGALIGSFAPIPFGTLIGAAIGGFIGKNRMEKERTEGKIVKENPTATDTIFSKEAATDGWIGRIGGALAGAAIGLLIPGGAIIGLGLAGLGAIVGSLMGASHGAEKAKERIHREYVQAAAMDSAVRGRGRVQEIEQDRAPTRSFAAQIEAERQQPVVVQR